MERRAPTTDLYEAAKAREGDANEGPTVLDEATPIPERRGRARGGGAPVEAGAEGGGRELEAGFVSSRPSLAIEASEVEDAAAGEAPAPPSAARPRPPQRVVARWLGEHRFEAGRPGSPTATIDGDAAEGQSPVDTLLSALATCAGYDVVDILEKQRTPLASMEIETLAERVATVPRRLERVVLTFRLGGEGIRQEQAERAVALSIEKYCSVRASLREDVAVEWRVELSG